MHLPEKTAEEHAALTDPVDQVAALVAEQLADTNSQPIPDQVIRYAILAIAVQRLQRGGRAYVTILDRTIAEITRLAAGFATGTVGSQIGADEASHRRFHWYTASLSIATEPELFDRMIESLTSAVLSIEAEESDGDIDWALSIGHLYRRAVEDGHEAIIETLNQPLDQLAEPTSNFYLRMEAIEALLRNRSHSRGPSLLASEIAKLDYNSNSEIDIDDIKTVFKLAVMLPRRELFDPIRRFTARSARETRTIPRPARDALAAYQHRWPEPLMPLRATD